jgi:hypothetical protein
MKNLPRFEFALCIFLNLLIPGARAQHSRPVSDSSDWVELGGMTLRLGMAQDTVTEGLKKSYDLQPVGAAAAGESTWMVETKTAPASVAVASVTFVGGGLSAVYKYRAEGSDPDTDAGIAGTLYSAVTRFQRENRTPCEVTTNLSQQPDGEVRSVRVACKGRQKFLTVDLVPMGDGKERVAITEVLKYPSDEIEILPETAEARPRESDTPSEPRAEEAERTMAERPSVNITPPPRIERTKTDRWYPQDIDQIVPPVASGTACPLPTVLSRAGKRIQELVDNVNKFTATEVVEHQSVDPSGQLRSAEIRKFSYLVSVAQAASGYLNVEEYRNGGSDPDQFPEHIATVGTPSLVMIFHPQHVKNFQMTCEGLGEWQDQPAWQIRFEELGDSRHRMSVLVLAGRAYGIRLRGRAWILADSYQVARLETDLAAPMPEIQLRLQHQNIEYRPVRFQSGGEIWLPATSEFYMDFRKHRFYRRHVFTDFQLFSVNVQQSVGDPKE